MMNGRQTGRQAELLGLLYFHVYDIFTPQYQYQTQLGTQGPTMWQHCGGYWQLRTSQEIAFITPQHSTEITFATL